VDIKERRRPAEGHRGAVLLLDAGEISKVETLHGFLRGARGSGEVEAVVRGHLLQFFERANLLAQFLPVADDFVSRMERVERVLFFLLAFDQARDTVKRNATVVTDDSAASVGVGKSGEDVRASAPSNVGG